MRSFNRKKLAGMLVVLGMLFCIQMPAFGGEPEIKPGDVNDDGIVNLTDFGLLLQQLLGFDNLSGAALTGADTNTDGGIDVADLIIAIQNKEQLNFSMEADATVVSAGQVVMVTLSATNLSTGTLNDVTLNFTMPEFADFGSFNPGETYFVDRGTLEIGETTSLNFPMTIRNTAPQGAQLNLLGFMTSAEGLRAEAKKVLTVDNSRTLRLGIRADKTTAEPGGRLRYTLHYGNQGILGVNDVVLTLPVPFGLNSPEAEDGGSIVAGLATWDLGFVAAGQTGQVNLNAMVDELETGELIQALAELNGGGNSVFASVSTPVQDALPLVFEFNTNADPVRQGQIFNVTMTASNRGDQPLNGISMSFIMPEFADSGSINPGEFFTVDHDTLAPGESVRGTLPVVVRSGANGPLSGAILHLNAFATTDEGYVVQLDRDLSVDNTPVLSLGIATNIDPAEPGKALSYSLNYGNFGNLDLANTVLRFRVPGHLADATVDKGGSINDGWAVWNLGTLAAGTNGQVNLAATVLPDTADGSVLQAEATIESGTESAHAALATTVRGDSPLVYDIAFGSDPVSAGQIVNVIQTVTNRGAQALNGVETRLIIPEYSDYSFNNPGETRTVTVGTLLPGQSSTEIFPLTIRSGASGPPDGYVLHINSWATSIEGHRSELTRTLKIENFPTIDVGIETDISPAFAGEPLRYTLHYGNFGLFDLTSTTLRMEIPAELLEPDPENGGMIVGNTAVWDLGLLRAGQSGQVHLRGIVDGGQGAAEVLRAQVVLETGAESARSAVSTAIKEFQSLGFDMYTSADPVAAGQIVQVSMTVTNTGAQQLNGVTMNYLMPEFADYSFTNPGEFRTFDIGDLAAGQSVTENFPVTVRSGSSGPPQGKLLKSDAWVSSTQGFRAELTRVLAVDNSPTLDVGIQTETNPAEPGEILAYTLHYGNFGLTDATDTVLTMELPAGLNSVTPEGNGVVDGRFVTWEIGLLQSGASSQVRLTGEVDPSLEVGELLRASAVLESGLESARSDLTAIVQTPSSPLKFDVSLDHEATTGGEDIIVSLTAGNTGAQVLGNVTVQVLMPDYADSGSFNPGEFRTLNLGDLIAGQFVSDHFPITMRTGSNAAPEGEILHLKARVTSTQGNHAELSRNFTVGDPNGLEIGLSSDVNPAVPGQPLVYALHYGNSSSETISSVSLRLKLPEGIEDPMPGSGGVVEGGFAVWDLGDLASGTTGVIHTTTTVSTISSGELLHAKADLTGEGAETHAMLTTAVRANSPLQYEVLVDNDPTTVGGVVNVTLRVTNTGPQVINDVVLRLIGPEYADFGSVNPGDLFTANQGDLNPGEIKSVNLTFTIRSATLTRPNPGTVIHIKTWANSAQGFRADITRDIGIGQ